MEPIIATIAGKERRFLFGPYGIALAEERHGVNLSGYEVDPEGRIREAKQMREQGKSVFGVILRDLWIAALPFDEDLPFEDFARGIGMHELEKVFALWNRIMAAQTPPEEESSDVETPGGEPSEGALPEERAAEDIKKKPVAATSKKRSSSSAPAG